MTANQTCAAPLSWYQIDRRLTGELDTAEVSVFDAHLRDCQPCSELWEREAKEVVSLHPLRPVQSAVKQSWLLRWRWKPLLLVAPIAVALLLILRMDNSQKSVAPLAGSQVGAKGGVGSLVLVRDHQDASADPRWFISGDRFQLQLTCESVAQQPVEVVVYQDDKTFFPLSEPAEISCTNERILPGAFVVTGDSPVLVCAVMSTPLPTREALGRMRVAGLRQEAGVLCEEIHPQ